MISGECEMVLKELARAGLPRDVALAIADTLQFDINGADGRFDLSLDGDVTRIISQPN